jgi:hypothetical protein
MAGLARLDEKELHQDVSENIRDDSSASSLQAATEMASGKL